MMVCHYGGFDNGYARSVVLRKALERRGHQIGDCSSTHPNVIARQVESFRAAIALGKIIDVLVVGTVAHYSMPAAFALAKALNRPLVFDIFDSIWETRVYDTWQLPEGSVRAEYYRHLDRSMAMLADLAVVDTELHAKFFADKIGVRASKLRHVPVGVDTDFFDRNIEPVRPDGSNDELAVGFVGSFFKSHGIDTILRAAKIVAAAGRRVRFDFYGDGPVLGEMKELTASLGLKRTHYHGRVPYADVPRIVAGFDVVLGLFGETGKVMHVVPNKAYEAAAMRKPFISGDTPAMRAAFEHGHDILLVPLADHEALARDLLELEASTTLRERLAQEIGTRFDRELSLDVIGKRWEQILLDACERHRKATA